MPDFRAMEHSQTEALSLECKELKEKLRNAKALHSKQEELILTLREVGIIKHT